MLIENSFTVSAPADELWTFLLDVEAIAPCLPGAELTETVDERTWKGTLMARFGPVAMSFAGTVALESRDDDGHRLVLKARGMEQRGRGAAEATVTSWLEPGPGLAETTVTMQTHLVLSGAAAQLSRGLLPEVSKKLTRQFADCLQASMAAGGAPPAAGEGVGAAAPEPPTHAVPGPAAKPVGGIRLGLSAIWASVVDVVRRLFHRRPKRP